jgi:protein-S-isoprenylcysteine O-methyltransferase Ste14
MSRWRHIRAIVLLPGTVAVLVPAVILASGEGFDIGWGAAVGLPLIAVGLAVWLWTVQLFARIGKGTLAPWDPTRRLVVRGPYRHVRNPMISGVLAVLVGEAAVLGSLPLLAWFLAFFCLNAIYMPLVEERSLERRFGADYLVYKRNVPRWIPRLRPWAAGGN